MSKQIILTHNGKPYTLEFNRKTIELMERQGFIISEVAEKPMTTLPALFAGAFLMHHKYVDRAVVDDMLYNIKDKENFIAKLVDMYNDPIATLMDEPEEDEGNIKWEASW